MIGLCDVSVTYAAGKAALKRTTIAFAAGEFAVLLGLFDFRGIVGSRVIICPRLRGWMKIGSRCLDPAKARLEITVVNAVIVDLVFWRRWETILRFGYLAVQTQVGGSGHLPRANVCLRRSAFLKTSGLIGPIPNFRLWRRAGGHHRFRTAGICGSEPQRCWALNHGHA
jgi:hypothetical protein